MTHVVLSLPAETEREGYFFMVFPSTYILHKGAGAGTTGPITTEPVIHYILAA